MIQRPCPNCGESEGKKFPDSDWCTDCVLAALDEQRKEDTHKVKPQVFNT
jgi:hypothetical protein